MTATEERLRAYGAFFERLGPDDMAELEDWFTADARFKDPFNDLRGATAVRRVFEHMFAVCDSARFTVHEVAAAGSGGYLFWTLDAFTGAGGGRRPLSIEGVSRVSLDAEGRVTEHVDYWDPAEQLYERVPLLGGLMRLIKRRLATPPG